ncbi:hypothetical protein BJX61DRAFT_266837 [Aspergillus egyptiacus]|nr:hypothetical protein BJX61DRAFT_266837 [Aspergillus egyptiacus]
MATVDDEIVPFPEAPTGMSPNSSAGQIPLEQPPKLKGRHKLLQSLQRISSSPSLTRRGRSRSSSNVYRRDGKASLSCVSLSQSSYTPCLSEGGSSQLYGGLNVRSATPGPAADYAADDQEANARVRFVSDASNGSQPRKVALPTELRPGSRASPLSASVLDLNAVSRPKLFDFWGNLPNEIGMLIFSYLTPREIIRCSAVCKWWNKMCFDGQLWSVIDTADYYSTIPPDALMKIMMSGGPFVKDLNLRGCVQLCDRWLHESEKISDTCRNVVSLCLEGARIDKPALHCFFLRNQRLESINVAGLRCVTNSTMKILANSCSRLRTLNVSWCSNVDASGLKKVVKACPELTELLASEIHGFDDEALPSELFKRNNLERLVISRSDITDDALKVLMHGINPEMDVLEDRPIVPPRQLKYLDLHKCTNLTDKGVSSLAHNVPRLEGLRLSGCAELTDDSLVPIIQTTPHLAYLELEELERLTNRTLVELAKSPCAPVLEHLNVSYCEALSDPGMLPVMKTCLSLRFVEMDNTRISDLTLSEASFRVRKRGYDENLPHVGLRLVIFDCPNVTWVGVKDVLSGNAFVPRQRKVPQAVSVVTQTINTDGASGSTTMPIVASSITPPPAPTVYPSNIIQLKCFYGWQMTVDEHTKRVLRGDLAAANRLERKWFDYMMATEEAGPAGAGARRRRRRAREAERIYNEEDEEEGSYVFGGILGARRRAHSGGSCVIM